jgi:hypothetical protein
LNFDCQDFKVGSLLIVVDDKKAESVDRHWQPLLD